MIIARVTPNVFIYITCTKCSLHGQLLRSLLRDDETFQIDLFLLLGVTSVRLIQDPRLLSRPRPINTAPQKRSTATHGGPADRLDHRRGFSTFDGTVNLKPLRISYPFFVGQKCLHFSPLPFELPIGAPILRQEIDVIEASASKIAILHPVFQDHSDIGKDLPLVFLNPDLRDVSLIGPFGRRAGSSCAVGLVLAFSAVIVFRSAMNKATCFRIDRSCSRQCFVAMRNTVTKADSERRWTHGGNIAMKEDENKPGEISLSDDRCHSFRCLGGGGTSSSSSSSNCTPTGPKPRHSGSSTQNRSAKSTNGVNLTRKVEESTARRLWRK